MTKITDLKEKERLTLDLLVKSCVKGITNKGATYLKLSFQDNTGVIDGNLWDAKPADIESAIVGHVETVTCEVLEYNHTLQLRVNHLEDKPQEGIDMRQFVMSSRYSQNELHEQINALVNSIQNKNMKTLVQGMFEKVGDRFFQYPAASRIHHNYLGGLAEHTLGMAKCAESICDLYPQLNRDLLISGVLLHDMGKTAELGGLTSSEYTEEGKLIGHISICHGWLMEVAEKKGLADSEEAILLRHMVLAHHGHQEFGSPVLPAIQEAEALYLIDNMDARMNTLRQQLKNVKPGHWTGRIFALENRQFYKPKTEERSKK